MPADNKLELVVEVDVNRANASIKSINTGLSSMEQAAGKAPERAPFLLAESQNRPKIRGDHSTIEKPLIETRLIHLRVEDFGQYLETHKRACQEQSAWVFQRL
jgi:hypothetical protein